MKTRKQLHGVIDNYDPECIFQVLKMFSVPRKNNKLMLHLHHTQARTCSTPVVFCFAHSKNSGAGSTVSLSVSLLVGVFPFEFSFLCLFPSC